MEGVANPSSVVIRNWPKMIFSWPMALGALAAGIIVTQMPEHQYRASFVFLLIFAANTMVLSFEFSGAVSFVVALIAVTTTMSMLLLNDRFEVIQPLREWVFSRNTTASSEFFYFVAGTLFTIHVGMFIRSRFDYWKLSPNELIHRKGLFANTQRYSTQGIKIDKEINDVFEFMLGGAGRMILHLPGVD